MARRSRHAKSKKARPLIIVLVVLFVFLVAAGATVLYFLNQYENSKNPVDPTDDTIINVTIPSGANTTTIADILKEKDLIKSTRYFKLYSKQSGRDGLYKSGDYELTRAMSLDEIMDELISGGRTVETVTFTVPEGYMTKQIRKRIVKEGLSSKEEFNEALKSGSFDYRFLEDIKVGKKQLDGFLYPDTYEVYADADAYEIITKMLNRFDELFEPIYYDRAEELGFSIREIVTLASLIERESKTEEERPIMARVFYNRMENGIKLESCASIQYLLDEPKEHLTYADLEIDSPYNTYLHEGLPPTPICSPRMASIEAALYPDENDYLYFVVSEKLDGSHNFSSDYNQFLADKAAYQEALERQG